MLKKIYILALLSFVSCEQHRGHSDKSSKDSLKQYYTSLKGSTVSKAKKQQIANILYQNLITHKHDLKDHDELLVLADFYKGIDPNKYRNINKIVLNSALSNQDTLYIAKACKNLGGYYIDNGLNDSSYYYYIKAEKLFLSLRNTSDLGEVYLDKAFIELYESDFSGSEISASKALPYLKQGSNKYKVYDAYNLLGVNSNELKNFEKAIEYHNRALEYLEENELTSTYHLDASSLNNIGYVYQNMKANKQAINYFERALKDDSLFKDNPSLYAMLLDNLGYSLFKLKDFKKLPSLFYKSLKIRDSLKTDSSGLILNKIHLSELYQFWGDTLRAQGIAKEALTFSRETKSASDILVSLQQLVSVDHKYAVTYSKEYIKISDSLQQVERRAKDKFARIQLETNEITLENDKLEEQNRNLLYFFIGTLMIGMLLFVIRMQRAKNRELLLKQAQQKANEDIYNLMITQQNIIEDSRMKEKRRIARELHDGILGRLFGARLNLDSLNRLTSADAIDKRINYLAELKDIEQDIREISHDLSREKHVLINNFVAILNNLLEEQQSNFNVELQVAIDDDIEWEKFDNTSKINLYRIIQECLQNINKYAKATNIKLEVKLISESLVLKVTDNGGGFVVRSTKKGIGLQNMISRTHEINGIFDIKSKKGKGTTVVVTFPTNFQNP